MSGSKYFVYGDRWRELDTETGLAAGWKRKVHFLYVRRGRLRVAKRRRVLTALQEYTAGRPSAVSVGSRLPMLSSNARRDGKAHKKTVPMQGGCVPTCGLHPHCGYMAAHPQCYAHYAPCNNKCMEEAPCDVTPQRVTNVASINNITNNSTAVPTDEPITRKHNNNINNQHKTSGSQFVALLQEHTVTKKTTLERDSKGRFLKSKERKVNSTKPSSNVNIVKQMENDRKPDNSDDESNSSEGLCKELTIPDSDVRALRSYVARTRRDALVRFDADNDYKLALFYAINPLVYVERCAQTERAIRERLPMALAPFAARLGLTPSPYPSAEDTQPKRRLRSKIRQEKLISSSNRCTEISSDSHNEDFQEISKRKSYNNVRLSKDGNKNQQINRQNKMHHSTVDNTKNNNVNMVKKSNKGSDTDYKSKKNNSMSQNKASPSIHKRHNNKRDSDSTDSDSSDSDSSGTSDSDADSYNKRNSLRPRTVHQSNRRKRKSSIDETRDSNKNSNKNREIRKNKKEEADSDSDCEIGKENKLSNLRNSILKQKRSKRDYSSDNSDAAENNLWKKVKTEKHNNIHQAYPKRDETGHSNVLKSPPSKTKLRRKVRQINQHLSNKQTNTHIIHVSDSEDDQNLNENEHNSLNKQTTLNKNIRNKTTVSATDSSSDFITNKRVNEKVKQMSLRNISNSGSSNITKIKKPTTTAVHLSDSDYLKQTESRSNSSHSTDLNTENTSTDSEPKTNKKYHKVNHSAGDSKTIEEKDNKRHVSLKRNRQDSAVSSLRKKFKIQKANPLQKSKPQVKTPRLNADQEIAQQSNYLVNSYHFKSKNNKESTKVNNNINTNKGGSDSDDIFVRSMNTRNILRKRNTSNQQTLRRDEIRRDNSSKVKAASDRRDNSSKDIASADRKDNSGKVKASSDIKADKLKVFGDKKDHSGRANASNDRKDNSSKVEVSRESDLRQTKKMMRHATNTVRSTAKGKGAHVVSKCNNVYSSLEDQAIVAWVSNGGRARRVNGNQLWKELLDQYHNLTGVSRTWHSLRNRYLRYILPSLGALGLTPRHAAALRAAAATGELKAKRMSNNRRNSIFKEKVVRTAFRPRRPPPTPSTSAGHTVRPDTRTDDDEPTKSKQEERVRTTRASLSASGGQQTRGGGQQSSGGGTARPPSRASGRLRRSGAAETGAATSTPTPTNHPNVRKLFNPNIVHDQPSSD